jgi:alanyl-tRNA synthetase
MTEKLYYQDPYKLEFEEEIIDIQSYKDNFAVFFNKTYFYPTSGGQPFDLGFIENSKIIDIFEKDGLVWHIVDKKPESNKVLCKIDKNRRLDHMQLHTGQHLLSQSFIKGINAPTISIHLGSDLSNIEIVTPEVTPEQIFLVEDIANSIIYENRNVNIIYASEEETNDLDLRKKPKKKGFDGAIRVIDIEDFDMSPCGGTHVQKTGEIGIIKIISYEKYKGNVRVEFLCGRRALNDYRQKNTIIKNISAKFSAKDTTVEDRINKSIEELKDAQRELSIIKKEKASFIANELIKKSELFNNVNIVSNFFDNEDMFLLKNLSQILVENNKCISILFSNYDNKTNLIISKSLDLPINLSTLTKELFSTINGKGGGKPELIQGSSEKIKDKELVLNQVKSIIVTNLK